MLAYEKDFGRGVVELATVGGRVITSASREKLEALMPSWPVHEVDVPRETVEIDEWLAPSGLVWDAETRAWVTSPEFAAAIRASAS